ncbi:MAG TPA: hypothetical protein VEY71_01910 [Chitinophagales bacterium]|nr:hypothetical protein [Chitinophagales bacterium]
MPLSTNDCPSCLEAVAPACVGFVTFKAGLKANGDVFVFIKGPRGALHKYKATVDGTGAFRLTPANYPPGFFVTGNVYTVSVYEDVYGNTPLVMTFGEKEHLCVSLSFDDILVRNPADTGWVSQSECIIE